MRALVAVCAVALWLAAPVAAADRYAVKGMVVSVNPAARTFTASIDAIPGFMAAMTMPFEVREAGQLQGLAAGSFVEFTLVVDQQTSFVEGLRIVPWENIEKDPFAASRLALLNRIVSPRSQPAALAVGAAVPDFALRNHRGQRVSLAAQRGKVVAINFIYTRCALPNFCLRLTTNFTAMQQRFADRLGKDLTLLTVTFDPTHDTAEVLGGYAAQWRAHPAWHFLTGSEADVQRVCQMFGVHAFTNEGLVDHSLHTVVIDRRGRLAANLEGNQFTAAQLGDLIAAQLASSRP
jgi:protein SCO1